jgi:Zc3h12a-like ribonuclease protein
MTTPAKQGDGGSDAASNVVLVDGSNVAHSTEGERAQVSNIVAIRDKLREEGLEPIIVADAALRHQIDDANRYEQLIDAGEVRQAPAGTDADYFILSFARELNASIVSNDRFRDRIKEFPEVRDRVIRYMIVQDEVVLERRTKRRGGGGGGGGGNGTSRGAGGGRGGLRRGRKPRK